MVLRNRRKPAAGGRVVDTADAVLLGAVLIELSALGAIDAGALVALKILVLVLCRIADDGISGVGSGMEIDPAPPAGVKPVGQSEDQEDENYDQQPHVVAIPAAKGGNRRSACCLPSSGVIRLTLIPGNPHPARR